MQAVLKKVPELTVLIACTICTYVAICMFSHQPRYEVLNSFEMLGIVLGSFLLSTAIAIIAVVGGIGGGVLFTPIVMAFTSIDTLIVRATGLVVAMFSGLVSAGPFMKKGLADIRLIFFCSVPIVAGALAGSFAAILLAEQLGIKGDAIVRLSLGCLLVFVAFLFVFGGSKSEYPEPKRIDNFSRNLGLAGSYWEESNNRPVFYQTTRCALGAFLFLLVGFIGGFFGLGGGAFVVAVLNIGMATPVKVAAASSGVLLSLSNSCAMWPYITYGALIAVFVAPWMLGQVIGGIFGAHILVRIKASAVRKLLILILFITSMKLISRGLEGLFDIHIPIL